MNKKLTEIQSNWLEPNAVARASGLYQFLKVSPSYALAHAIRTERISKAKQTSLVSELYGESKSASKFVQIMDGFNKVLETYDVVGDVYSRHFDTWFIKEKGYRLFGYKEAPPQVSHITSIADSEPLTRELGSAINNYFAKTRTNNGNPPMHLIAVPAGIGVSKQIELLRGLLSELESHTSSYASSKPYFAFEGQRFRLDPIEKYLKTITLRAISPNRPLWQLAAINELSNSIRFKDPWTEKATAANSYHRGLLNSLAFRAIIRAKYMAEHASQGVFPSHERIAVPEYDWDKVAKRMIA